MLIFLAALAALLMLLMLGDRAAMHVGHGGLDRFFDYCAACEVRYARPAEMQLHVCPQGHLISDALVEPHGPRSIGNALIAACAGFAGIALLLTVAGVSQWP